MAVVIHFNRRINAQQQRYLLDAAILAADGEQHILLRFQAFVNAADVEVTGRKELQKVYHRHSGYPGGKRETPLFRMRATFPERIILNAVKGMLPDNKLKAKRLMHLHIFKDTNHPYSKNFKKIVS